MATDMATRRDEDMGWAVGHDFAHRRFRGYGVPAYCDAYGKTGCRAEIDRGLGYLCEGTACDREGENCEDGLGCFDLDELDINIFVCGEHTCRDVDEHNLPPEHPDWVAHLLTDGSWKQWREENPKRVDELRREVAARAGAGSAAFLNADGTDFES